MLLYTVLKLLNTYTLLYYVVIIDVGLNKTYGYISFYFWLYFILLLVQIN